MTSNLSKQNKKRARKRERHRHKVKMKPVGQLKADRFRPDTLLVTCQLLIAFFLQICDTAMQTPQAELSLMLGSARQQPHFDHLQRDQLVVASKWQSEVFLPCRILDLDEEQTVSKVTGVVAIMINGFSRIDGERGERHVCANVFGNCRFERKGEI